MKLLIFLSLAASSWAQADQDFSINKVVFTDQYAYGYCTNKPGVANEGAFYILSQQPGKSVYGACEITASGSVLELRDNAVAPTAGTKVFADICGCWDLIVQIENSLDQGGSAHLKINADKTIEFSK